MRKGAWGMAVAVAIIAGAMGFGAGSAAGTARAMVGNFSPTGGILSHDVSTQGETFYKATNFQFPLIGGTVILSANPDGTGNTLVDDEVIITVTRPDTTKKTFKHDYSGGCGPLTELAPRDITNLFQVGTNKVVVTLKDLCGAEESSSSLWISNL